MSIVRVIRGVALVVCLFGLVLPVAAEPGERTIPLDELFSKRLSNPYGAPVPVELAKNLAQAVLTAGKQENWRLAVAVVDPGGDLVYFERADATQSASPDIAIEKARAAVAFRRSTKLIEDRIVAGRLQYLRLPNAMPIEGGVPIVVDGLIVGGIAVSGARSEQDGQALRAAMETLPALLSRDTK